MANEIETQIEQIAEKMTKSVTDGKQALFDTILTLGPEGLKKALPTLAPEQQALIQEALIEMKKALSSPEATADAKKLAAEKTSTKHGKMKQESNSGSDDEDEKLMEEKNKDHKAQGGPSDKPEGWEGQIIKAKEPPHKGPHGGVIIGHTKDGKPIYEHAGHESHKEFEPHHHDDASEAHMRVADKHQQNKDQNPYSSIDGLRSLGGDKKKFDEAKDKHTEDSGEHLLHRESSAFHRRMADSKRNIPGDSNDIRPEDHKAQADRHLDRVNKLHDLRKCGYMMKDAGQGGAGDYGMALSMNKSIGDQEDLCKSLFSNCLKASDAKDAPDMTKEQCRNEIQWKIQELKTLRELAWMIEDEAPEAKEMMEKKFSKIKGEIKSMCEKHADLKKAYENFMTKADGKKSFAEVEEHAREEGAKDPKAVAAAVGFKTLGKEEMERRAKAGKKKAMEKAELSPEQKLEKKKMRKAKKIAKSLKKIIKLAKSLGLSKEEVKKAIEEAGGDLKVVKSEMKEKINKEEDQVKIKTQDESEITAPKPDESKGALEIKPDETADEALKKLPKVEKSLAPWQMKSSIAAGSLGRNTHWDVDGYIESAEAEKQEIIKKGGYFGEKAVEELKKSEAVKKADLNDMIEKGYDYSPEEISRIESNRNHKPDAGAVRKSNYDVAIAESMGMSKDEYEKIFGSNE